MKAYKILLLALCYSLSTLSVTAQGDPIRLKNSHSPYPGRQKLVSVKNLCDTTIFVLFINEYEGKSQFAIKGEPPVQTVTLEKGKTVKKDITYNLVKVKRITDDAISWVHRYSTPLNQKDEPSPTPKNNTKDKPKDVSNDKKNKDNTSESLPKPIDVKSVIKDFYSCIDSIPFYSMVCIQEDSASIQKHLDILQLTSTNTEAYIKEQNLVSFVDSLEFLDRPDSTLIDSFLIRYAGKQVKDSVICVDSLKAILESRIALREAHLAPLKTKVEEAKEEPTKISKRFIAVCVGLVLLCLGLFFWYYKVNKANKRIIAKRDKQTASPHTETTDAPLIQVIRPSITSLRKQSLEDVYENAAYLKINAADFCSDSAVRSLYFKNTCIKDIYNMYAEDLRNPNNPKEDGCMVIGRWVYDEVSRQYDVSLEEIVRPGDDAVFAEYELNFGGKIKLRMSERLRKLRTETGLQYDLTCWVHSHPGLGVFFSNADNNVNLLKHHSHPHFLTALVIDILTPEQETGIFTFRNDGVINSKNDLTKMYSLEEMYKWALESGRRSFDANDYFNTLGKISFHQNECYGIQLSNGAIIDMTFLTSKPNGFIGFAHGFTLLHGDRMECVTSAVSKNETVPDSEMIGCFVVATHCSIPSIRKAVARYIHNIHFVLVYTSTDGLLTSIPVVNQELCTSDTYYGRRR